MDWKEEIRNRNEVRRRLNRLAWLLDSSIPIPGTRFSIGIDALIGLVPFIGDLVGVLLSSTILVEAARLGAGRSVLARMALNVAVEGLAGLVPFAGDVFDAAWKANQRNVRLLNQWLDQPQRAERSSVLLVAGLVAGLVALVVILLLLGLLALRWLMDCC
ncbi:MAG TPA: DUF4112 domain-containing protein [Burkholderiales bacterium]|nr:DUF4112 domain-containing protein [Burkholderiales bacterium]